MLLFLKWLATKHITRHFYFLVYWVILILQVQRLEKRKSDSANVKERWARQLYSYNVLPLLIVNNIQTYWYYVHSNYNDINNFNHYSNFKNKQLNYREVYLLKSSFVVYSAKQLSRYGLKSVWNHSSNWLLPVTIGSIFLYYSFFLRLLPFSKIFGGCILLGNILYLLFSGFVFFLKKYQYRLYTSAIQRFWRRTLIIFWIIEGSLFMCFLYLTLNASQEPVHTYDNIQIYKTHFYSWRFFLIKNFLAAILVLLVHTLVLSIKWNTFVKNNNVILLITAIILYISWMEFYQLYHMLGSYGTVNWVYSHKEHLWDLELEFRKTRIVNHFVTLTLIAKFWHIVFVTVFWLFFVLRGFESSTYNYSLLVANLQNFLIVYFMGWLYMYPWFKFVLRKVLDLPYFWFFVNNRKLGTFLLFNDIKLYYWGLADCVPNNFFKKFYKSTIFFYWYESSTVLNNTQFRGHNTRDLFIRKAI